MKCSMRCAVVVAFVLTTLIGAQGATFRIDLATYDQTALAGSSVYYSDNNLSADGNFLAGQIGYGPREISHADGSAVNGYTPVGHTAKSAIQLGSYIFYSHQDGGGIARLDAATWANATALVNPTNAVGVGSSCEAICTDGTLIFGNDDGDRDTIHAWAIDNSAGSFTADHQWSVTIPTGTRIRGFSYADGYIYACGFGNTGDRSIYAIRVSDQAITDTGVDVPGTETGYGTIRGGTLLMALTTGHVYVWDLTSPTSADAGSMDTYTSAQLSGGNNMYSLSYSDERLLVGWAGAVRVFDACAQARVAPILSGQLGLKRTMTVDAGSTYNPRMHGGEVYAVDITAPGSVSRFRPGSTTPDAAKTGLALPSRMLSPMGGNSTKWVIGSGSSEGGNDYFKRYDYATLTNETVAANSVGDLEPNSFAWVDSDTIISVSYQIRDRLYLFDVTADPFSTTSNTTWNANGYIDTAATGARLRNVTVGDWYSGYAYYADSLDATPDIYALDLATGVETVIGSMTIPDVVGSYADGPWQCKEVEGYMYIQTTDNGIYVYDMVDAVTLGSLYTHHTKAQLDAATGDGTSNYGSDVSDKGRRMVLSAGSGKVAELGRAGLPFWEDFESYPDNTTIADLGDYGWSASTNATVEAGTGVSASQGAQLPGDSSVTNTPSVTVTEVWTDFWLKPVKRDSDPDVSTNASVMAYVNTDGYLVLYDDDNASPGWVVCSNSVCGGAVTPIGSDYARISLHQDYAANEVAAFLDGLLVREQLPIIGDATEYEYFAVQSSGDTNAYLDNVLITTDVPPCMWIDCDGDGVADAEEIDALGSISATVDGIPGSWFLLNGVPPDADLDTDADTFTAGQEYWAGTDPDDMDSYFVIIDEWMDGGTNYVEFIGNDSGDDTPYIMERCIDLTAGWSDYDSSVPRATAPDTTTVWGDPAPPAGAAFYRPKALIP